MLVFPPCTCGSMANYSICLGLERDKPLLNQMFSSLRMNDECDINALSIDINALSCCQ
eukprot:m.182136 g.182136  ORF g.182136 m.182136 type:complete len:58 (+) comp16639_c4_seq3:1370-1543(+)